MVSKASGNGLETKQVQILLMLWDMTGGQGTVKRSELTNRTKRSREKVADYQPALDALQNTGAIAISTNQVGLTEKGIDLLGHGLQKPQFVYEGNQGAKVANALLKWIRQQNGKVTMTAPEAKQDITPKIESYEAFERVALEVYEQLNRDYNYDNLVPIYRIRREIGDRVSRTQFNEWLLEMQANDILQLIGGEMPSLTPDKAEDSIETKLGGMRYYAKRL